MEYESIKSNDMQKFNYYIDRKHTIWAREKYEVDASTQQEADEIMKKELKGDNVGYVESYDFEYIYDTSELMWTEENKGFPTAELYNSNGELLLTNTNQTT